jgi:lipopolysaccharide transport system permease protein
MPARPALTELKSSTSEVEAAGLAQAPAPVVVRRGTNLGQIRELVAHLVVRELSRAHRETLLGWAWPLVLLLVQLAALVFIFGHVVDLSIPNYPVFLFTGLIAWTWFLTGVQNASWSLITHRDLVLQPNCPPVVLPVVTVAVPIFDLAVALPLLVAMTLASGTFEWTVVLLVPLFALQFLLMLGIAWIVAAISVYLRDVPRLVALALMILFYLTPVFYAIERVPERFQSILLANPLGTLIESYRAVTLGDPFPPAGAFIAMAVGSGVLVAVGLWIFRALEGGFVDEL